jgi:hypothetical protein
MVIGHGVSQLEQRITDALCSGSLRLKEVRILATNLAQARTLSRAHLPQRRPSQLAMHDSHKLRERNKDISQCEKARSLDRDNFSAFVTGDGF